MTTYSNRIKFNCAAYMRNQSTRPNHCYNCMIRNGYPQLGGDTNCNRFKQTRKHLKCRVCGLIQPIEFRYCINCHTPLKKLIPVSP